MKTSRHLLVLDEQRDTEQVLKAVLEPTGTQVTRVRSWQQLQDSKPNHKETVLVIHSCESLESHPEADNFNQMPRVIIGKFKKQPENKSTYQNKSATPENSEQKEQQLDDLFEFNDLLQAIDSLWKFTS